MKKKFTVYITKSYPPFEEEVALTLYAESKKDAEKKAQEWFLKNYYTFSAEVGPVDAEEISEETRLVTIDKNGNQRNRHRAGQ